MAHTKPKTVSYRRCQADDAVGDGGSFNLQELIAAAAKKNQKPYIRDLGAGGNRKQFLAHLVKKQLCECGTLVLYEDGRKIPLIDAENDGSTWEGQMEPVDTKGKKRKLQEQALYFAVRENHLAVIQTRELSVKDLQDFLVWFIQSKAELADVWLFTLQNLPSKKAMEKLKDHTIKEITIGKQAFSTSKEPVPDEEKQRRKKYRTVIKPDPFIMELLRYFVHDNAILENLEKSSDPGSIYVGLEIKYKSRSEKDSQRVMQAVAATFGGQPDLNPEIILDGKSRIRGDELTIAGEVQVQCPGGNVSADDAMTRLAEWLTTSIKAGKIWT
jgi:hypothetical protein